MTEEREKPELLAESPARRKRIAQDSGKTEQQVCQVFSFMQKLLIIHHHLTTSPPPPPQIMWESTDEDDFMKH